MSASALAVRRASGPLLRTYDRSNSCPDLSATVARMKLRQPARNLNLMVMHPRAPKIRHLNASHSLLIEMEKHVRKVQELEHKVGERELYTVRLSVQAGSMTKSFRHAREFHV